VIYRQNVALGLYN